MQIKRLGPEDEELLRAAVLELLPSEPGSRETPSAAPLGEALKQSCRADGVSRIWAAGTSLDNRAAQRTFEATGARRESKNYVETVYDLEACVV